MGRKTSVDSEQELRPAVGLVSPSARSKRDREPPGAVLLRGEDLGLRLFFMPRGGGCCEARGNPPGAIGVAKSPCDSSPSRPPLAFSQSPFRTGIRSVQLDCRIELQEKP